jgi:hypothetical protein
MPFAHEQCDRPGNQQGNPPDSQQGRQPGKVTIGPLNYAVHRKMARKRRVFDTMHAFSRFASVFLSLHRNI